MSKQRRKNTASPDDEANHHNVGYGRPPREHQFPPGKSGNPRGRPKGSKSASAILFQVLNRKLRVRQDGKEKQITVLEAIIVKFADEALKANARAAHFLFNLTDPASKQDQNSNVTSADDQKILDAFVSEIMAKVEKSRS